MRRLLRLIAPLLLLAAAPPGRQAHPALWKLSDADTTIWLLGTIHVLPAGYRWRDPAIDAAIAGSQSLTLETVLDQDPQAVARLLLSIGRADGLPPLADRVPKAKRGELAALVKASGFPAPILDGMKSWAAAVVLTGAALRQIDLGPGADGVEPQLTKDFRSAGKPVDGLETPAQQLGFFDMLPESTQRSFLTATLEEPAEARAEFREMLVAWGRGDVAALARAFARDPELTPELRAVLVDRRNAAWAATLQRRLARPGTSFVAVGAGHLAGHGSLIELLRARGLRVQRVTRVTSPRP